MKLKFKFSGNMMNRFLDMVEKGGNILPHPATLFALMALFVVVMSGVAALFDITAVHPGTGEIIKPVSLLNGDGLRRIITGMVKNFTNFAPLGTVLVAMLGVGVAEGSGVIGASLRLRNQHHLANDDLFRFDYCLHATLPEKHRYRNGGCNHAAIHHRIYDRLVNFVGDMGFAWPANWAGSRNENVRMKLAAHLKKNTEFQPNLEVVCLMYFLHSKIVNEAFISYLCKHKKHLDLI